jgi:CDP-glucose 4,6-dehydratase
MVGFKPDCVFHLAAQPIVRASYRDPIETFATNVLGSANVFEAARKLAPGTVFVNVTSDKCYENNDWEFGYRETDPLGGADPYSASKGCAEIVFSSYFRSFLGSSGILAASGRAGNVIGGGDFAEDRLIPDCVRAWSRGETVTLRNPEAIRPWQHVLEPLGGYLALGAFLGSPQGQLASGSAYNFGPLFDACEPVAQVVQRLCSHFPGGTVQLLNELERAKLPHEARTLKLSIDRAKEVLGWRPTLSFSESVEWTATWYNRWATHPKTLLDLTRQQISDFERRA